MPRARAQPRESVRKVLARARPVRYTYSSICGIICGRAEARGQTAYSGVQAAVSVSRWQVGTQARLRLAGVAHRGRC